MDREYELKFAKAGVPEAGLVPVFHSLQKVSDGTNFDAGVAGITITELKDSVPVGHGDYIVTVPDTVTDRLTGWVDGGAALDDADRYVPISINADDFGLTDLLDRLLGSIVLDAAEKTETIKRRDGSELVVFNLTLPLDPNVAIGPFVEKVPE
jgi:hypothetical protein